jgi:hypothetical protein
MSEGGGDPAGEGRRRRFDPVATVVVAIVVKLVLLGALTFAILRWKGLL